MTPILPSLAPASHAAAWGRDWIVAAASLALMLCLFMVIFQTEIITAVNVWSNSDAYNHCFLVLPVAAYLVWQRRAVVTAIPLRPAPWVVAAGIPIAAGWFVADRLGIMEGRQLMAMALLEIIAAAILGLRLWWALAAPFLYLFFLVPFGEFLVPPLQDLVVHFTTIGLDLLGIPNFVSGIAIEIPEGTFLVHQACSGLRFLVATTAFGVFYACIVYTSPFRRLLFSLFAIGVAVVANCVRVLGTILAAHFIGNAQAVAADHVVWGWAFYVVVGAILIAAGLLFRQDARPPVSAKPSGTGSVAGRSAAAILALTVLLIMPRLTASHLDGLDDGRANAAQIELPAPAGCSSAPPPSTPSPGGLLPSGKAVDGARSAAYLCGGDVFVVTVRRYPARIGVRPLFADVRAAEEPTGGDILLQTQIFDRGAGPNAARWRVTETSIDGRYITTATALWVDGRPTDLGLAARVDQAMNSLRPAPLAPVLVVVTYSHRGEIEGGRLAMDAFLAKASQWSSFIREWTGLKHLGIKPRLLSGRVSTRSGGHGLAEAAERH